jgi:hypothetical protein
VLVMPDGALSEDLRNCKLVQKYIADNAGSWYEYAESDDCGMQPENGDIRVVIGMDKVSSWGMATFENVNLEEPLRFEFKDDGRGSQGRTYKWDSVSGRAGPPEEEIRDLLEGPNTSPLRNQCVFVRTLNVSVAGGVRDELAVCEIRASYTRDWISDSGQHRARSVELQTSQIARPVSFSLLFSSRCQCFQLQGLASIKVIEQVFVRKGLKNLWNAWLCSCSFVSNSARTQKLLSPRIQIGHQSSRRYALDTEH